MPRQRVPRFLRADERARIVSVAGSPTDRAVVVLGLYVGLRVSEMAKLRIEQVDVDGRLLACVLAESGLNGNAERWGRYTSAARSAIGIGDWGWLQSIVDASWPDISFGYGQRIVLYHWLGDRQATAENCMAVREGVRCDPGGDFGHCAEQLGACMRTAAAFDLGRVGGDAELGALVVYNAGHWPDPVAEAGWWDAWAGNVASYARMLARLRG